MQRVTRHQLRFYSYLAHIMSVTPLYAMQNMSTLEPSGSLLDVIEVSAKYQK